MDIDNSNPYTQSFGGAGSEEPPVTMASLYGGLGGPPPPLNYEQPAIGLGQVDQRIYSALQEQPQLDLSATQAQLDQQGELANQLGAVRPEFVQHGGYRDPQAWGNLIAPLAGLAAGLGVAAGGGANIAFGGGLMKGVGKAVNKSYELQKEAQKRDDQIAVARAASQRRALKAKMDAIGTRAQFEMQKATAEFDAQSDSLDNKLKALGADKTALVGFRRDEVQRKATAEQNQLDRESREEITRMRTAVDWSKLAHDKEVFKIAQEEKEQLQNPFAEGVDTIGEAVNRTLANLSTFAPNDPKGGVDALKSYLNDVSRDNPNLINDFYDGVRNGSVEMPPGVSIYNLTPDEAFRIHMGTIISDATAGLQKNQEQKEAYNDAKTAKAVSEADREAQGGSDFLKDVWDAQQKRVADERKVVGKNITQRLTEKTKGAMGFEGNPRIEDEMSNLSRGKKGFGVLDGTSKMQKFKVKQTVDIPILTDVAMLMKQTPGLKPEGTKGYLGSLNAVLRGLSSSTEGIQTKKGIKTYEDILVDMTVDRKTKEGNPSPYNTNPTEKIYARRMLEIYQNFGPEGLALYLQVGVASE